MQPLNKYPLSLTSNYVSDWGLWEAVREIIQNALDSDTGHSISYDSSEEILTVSSSNIKLEPNTLLLGTTTKRSDNSKIGNFGEGFKVASLVLLKEGFDLTINNSDLTWKPSFQHSELFNAEVLTIDEYRGSALSTSLEFIISGVSSEDYENIRQKTLHLDYYATHNVDTDYLETTWGNIILEGGGAVYVNGLFVCNENNSHSYDIKPEYLKLDRDRNSVSGWDFTILRSKMWSEAGLVDSAVKAIISGSYEFSYIHSRLSEEDKQKIIDSTVERYGESYFVGSQEEADNLINQGEENVKVIDSGVATLINDSGLYNKVAEIEEKQSPWDYINEMCNYIQAELDDVLSNSSSEKTAILDALEKLQDESSNWSN